MITPIEIRKHTFRKSLRGYDTDEVQAFLQTLSDEWEQQQQDMRQMKAQMDQLQADYNSLKKVENMLHKTLLQAEQSAKTTLDNALQKAELKIQAAEAQAREIVRRGEDGVQQLYQDIDKLEGRKEEIVLHLEVFLKNQLDRVRAFERRELPAMGYSAASREPIKTSVEPSPIEKPVEAPAEEPGLFQQSDSNRASDFSDEL